MRLEENGKFDEKGLIRADADVRGSVKLFT